MVEKIDLTDANAIKTLAYNLEKEVGQAFIVFGSVAADKPLLTVCLSADVAQNKSLNAGQLVREWAKEIKGGGGGQPTFATAGGTDVSGLEAALAKAKAAL